MKKIRGALTLLVPKKTKYRRQMRGGKSKGAASRGVSLDFGKYALKALGSGRLSSRQIEAARKAITHYTKRSGKLWIRVFPDKPITKKPNEVGMGKGKGSVDHYEAKIRAGRIIFELDGVSENIAREALRLASEKLPVKAKVISDEQ